MHTYPLIALIKLDFPAPEMPVIAMCTSTSFHPSILLLKKFAVESGLRRPFLSISFWKSCAYFDSQFIAIGWLETERYAACCERKWASTTTKPYYIEGYTWRNILYPRAFAHVITPRRRVFGCSRCFWDIRLKMYRLPNIYMLFQLVLTKFFKKLAVSVFTGSWSRDQVITKGLYS